MFDSLEWQCGLSFGAVDNRHGYDNFPDTCRCDAELEWPDLRDVDRRLEQDAGRDVQGGGQGVELGGAEP